MEASADLLLASTEFSIIHLVYEVITRVAWELRRREIYVLVCKEKLRTLAVEGHEVGLARNRWRVTPHVLAEAGTI